MQIIRTFFIYLNLHFSLSSLLDSLITPLSRSAIILSVELSAASFIVHSFISEKRKEKLKEIKDNECRIASMHCARYLTFKPISPNRDYDLIRLVNCVPKRLF